jgi:hypothetical protein
MPSPKAASYVCVYFGTPGECHNCGGWTKSVGEDGVAGPFPGDARYCSEDCFAEAQEFAERARRQADDWCSSCGFDRHEHAQGCERSGLASTVRPLDEPDPLAPPIIGDHAPSTTDSLGPE